MNAPKLCKDCWYHVESPRGSYYDECKVHANGRTELVRGERQYFMDICHLSRQGDWLDCLLMPSRCGPKAKFWEPK